MDPSNKKARLGHFLTDEPIKICVGEEKKIYHVHPGVLIESESSTTSVRLAGHWKDTGSDTIDWSAFDKRTIECVLQYMYVGDYYIYVAEEGAQTPEPADGSEQCEQKEVNDEEPKDEPQPVNLASEPPQISPQYTDPNKRPLTPISRCIGIRFPVGKRQTASGYEAYHLGREDYGVGISLLVHARVYAFASQNFFPGLKQTALARFTQMLSMAKVDRDIMFPYLADAIRHIYDMTPGPEIEQNPARKLVSQYVALNYLDLAGEDIQALAAEGGEFWSDVLNKMGRLIATTQQELQSLRGEVGTLSGMVRGLEIRCTDQERELTRTREASFTEWPPRKRVPSKSHRKQTFRGSNVDSP